MSSDLREQVQALVRDWRELAWEAGENPHCDPWKVLWKVLKAGDALADAADRILSSLPSEGTGEEQEQTHTRVDK